MVKSKKLKKQQAALKPTIYMAAMQRLSQDAGFSNAPIIPYLPVEMGHLPLTDQEIEHLAKYRDTEQGRKAKKAYVRQLESKYHGKHSADSSSAGAEAPQPGEQAEGGTEHPGA